MLIALALIVSLILLVFIHELGHFIAAKQAGIRVEEFGFGFPPRMFGIKKGETLYSVNWLPLGGFVRIYGENRERLEIDRASGGAINEKQSFAHQSLRVRCTVIAAGISINIIAGWILLVGVNLIGARQAVVITQIQPESPAAVAGLVAGDELQGFKTAEEFVAFTHSHTSQEVAIQVIRDGAPQQITAQLRETAKPGEGVLGAAVSDVGFEALSFVPAIKKATLDTINAVAEIWRSFGRLIVGLFTTATVPENIVGPVGIFGIAGSLSNLGIIYIVQLIAMISLNLGALNAIPFPALDGGRLLFLLIEKIRGAPVHHIKEAWAHGISFVLLIVLMLVITGRDIARLI